MMSPDNHNRSPAAKPATGNKDETQGSTPRKAGSARPPEPALKCPRCDSPNTKFCYYNNYSLTQPRHFCKTCRRYWTKGGALRNVPIGGGCRKSKKMKSSPRLSGGSKDSTGSGDHIGGLKFFQGISPAMDFNLGGINFNNPSRVPTQSTGLFNQLSSYGDMSQAISSNPTFDPSSLGASSPFAGFNFAHQEMGSSPSSLNVHSNLASSIESLSSINQDLHWKLQQQRLAMLFVGDNQKENISNASLSTNIEPLVQKPQPILFQNLDVSKPDQSCGNIGTSRKDCGVGGLATEWYFDNGGYATHHVQAPTPATSSSNVNDQNNSSNWSGFQAWGDLNQYTALP